VKIVFVRMNKIFIAVILILVVIIGGFYFLNGDSTLDYNPIFDSDKDALKPGMETTDPVPAPTGNARTFVIDSSHLRFYMNGVENPDLVVNEGDHVRIEFSSSEGFHDWKIDDFTAATEKVNPGNSTFVEFIADKKGTFEYYCSVGQHRTNGMKGKFIVQ